MSITRPKNPRKTGHGANGAIASGAGSGRSIAPRAALSASEAVLQGVPSPSSTRPIAVRGASLFGVVVLWRRYVARRKREEEFGARVRALLRKSLNR